MKVSVEDNQIVMKGVGGKKLSTSQKKKKKRSQYLQHMWMYNDVANGRSVEPN
jgi:hypothetical protein